LNTDKACKALGLNAFIKILLLASGVLFAALGAAQATTGIPNTEQNTGLEEIVVIANKRAENLQDAPISISVVTASDLATAGVVATSDIAIKVPALSFEITAAGFQPFIRGVGTPAAGASNENSVATYIDGVYLAEMTGGLLALNNAAQIEIDKGPQGTLFGRNATGGVININTRTPNHDFSAHTQVDFGDYQTVSTTDYVTGGITSALAADVAFFYQHQNQGYGRDLTTGHDIGGDQEVAFRTKWLFTPTDKDSITLSLDYERTDNGALFAQRIVPGTVTNWGTGATLAGARPDQAPYIAAGALAPFAVVGHPTFPMGGPHDIQASEDPEAILTQGGVSIRAQHDFDIAELTSISAYRKDKNIVNWSANPVPDDVQQAGWNEDNQQLTQELQLGSLASSQIKWVGGLFFLRRDVEHDPFYIRGTSLSPLNAVQFDADQGTKSYAAFGQATSPLFIVPATDVTVGVRYTDEKKKIIGETYPIFPAALAFLDGPTALTNANATFKKFTYRFALDHHFTDDVLGYVSYNRGFKSGGFNMIPPGGPTATAVLPETLDAYELGLKNELMDRRLRLNAAAFYYKWNDLQVTTFNNTTAITTNAAKAELYGLDLDADYEVIEHLTFSASATLLKDHFLSYPDAQFNIPQPFAAGGGTIALSESAAGNRLPYAPDVAFSASASYLVPISAGSLLFSATYYYNSGFYLTADNASPNHQEKYQLVSARVQWTAPNGKTKVGLWGKNLLNAVYATGGQAGTNPGGYEEEVVAPPRTFGVTLQQDF
jgi:iron complex outermembrane recepter protein